jgi:hypothetical protein
MLPLTEGLKVLDPSWGQHSPRACQYDDPSSWVVCQLTRQKNTFDMMVAAFVE